MVVIPGTITRRGEDGGLAAQVADSRAQHDSLASK